MTFWAWSTSSMCARSSSPETDCWMGAYVCSHINVQRLCCTGPSAVSSLRCPFSARASNVFFFFTPLVAVVLSCRWHCGAWVAPWCRGKGGAGAGAGGDDPTAGVRTRSSIATLRGEGPLDVKTVFSQARNGRMKRLSESLGQGFDVNSMDEFGNTLLLIGAQNVNRKLCEMLLGECTGAVEDLSINPLLAGAPPPSPHPHTHTPFLFSIELSSLLAAL